MTNASDIFKDGAENLTQIDGAMEAPPVGATSGVVAPNVQTPPPATEIAPANTFLARPRPTIPLTEITTYRPGARVALLCLIPPVVTALAGAALMLTMRGAPFWLALAPLIWLPFMLVGWLTLRNVRLARDQLAVGGPLRSWRIIRFEAIRRLETRGAWIILTTRAYRVAFIPALLARGGELRRRLLMSLPLSVLSNAARAEASYMLEGAFAEGLEEEALTVRLPLWLDFLAAFIAVALVAAAWIDATAGMVGVSIALAVCGAFLVGIVVWMAQEIAINAHGVSLALGRQVIARASWDDLKSIRRTPGELALILIGRRLLIIPGPALFYARDARRIRQIISLYARERGLMTAPQPRF